MEKTLKTPLHYLYQTLDSGSIWNNSINYKFLPKHLIQNVKTLDKMKQNLTQTSLA